MHLCHKCAFVFVQNFVPVLIRIDLLLVSVCVKLELHVCSARLSKRSWVLLVITYLLCIASFHWPFKYHWLIILHDTLVHPYLLHCQSARNREVWNFTKHWKKEKGQVPTQVAVCRNRSKRTGKRSDSVLWQLKNATKNFDYTTILDRLWTVSWSNDSYPTG